MSTTARLVAAAATRGKYARDLPPSPLGLREDAGEENGEELEVRVRAKAREELFQGAEERLRSIEIDRSGLVNVPSVATEPVPGAEAETLAPGEQATQSEKTPLVDELKLRISSRGPVSMSEFMTVALGHPKYGYYMTRDAFGKAGDFTTSPEISQVFGELIGVWCVSQWMAMGSPESVRLVELGPGRGTLMSDLLRAVSSFPDFCRALQKGDGVRMVETSPVLRRLQQKKLRCTFTSGAAVPSYEEDDLRKNSPASGSGDQERMDMQGQAKHMDDVWEIARKAGRLSMRAPLFGPLGKRGNIESRSVKVEWMREFNDVRKQNNNTPTLVVAQELFDALPVHQFEVNKKKEWVERLVDVEPLAPTVAEADVDPEKPLRKLHHFRFVLSTKPTPATKMLLSLHEKTAGKDDGGLVEGDAIEVCAVGAALMQDITECLSQCGGAALVIDYGDNGAARSSLRGIKKHAFVHPLTEPGEVDLSADVDFHFLRYAAQQVASKMSNPVRISETLTQGSFLRNMGIETRIGTLLHAQPDEEKQMEIFMAFQRLVEGDFIDEDTEEVIRGMGESYKAMALYAVPPSAPRGATPAPEMKIAGFVPPSGSDLL
ncbi:Protein arginine methyltransferase NDUFAF7, mitochondrial [Hondaea fermentalgiana]|uniref:type II protein arginine methyltransferase n=1 Tax=Hondaea fermentalgiana TaxID=2315210 RepID=A0A2R5GGI4_9STRA|nr:Protein arginine methyltransferase NDUFAF7, mitochondrial [Hondaea fermentalgiana]|eukprot:GBG27371.1 Protein arginine methyltransferase NDUFAF7, mitochondrial [Hondaea fermentalgiana]